MPETVETTEQVENPTTQCTTQCETRCDYCDDGVSDNVSCDSHEEQVEERPVRRVVSFENVNLNNEAFSEDYIVLVGSATQVALGMQYMSQRTGDGENEYQRSLYPKLRELSLDVYNKFYEKLLTSELGVQRQVFGANLNGPRNTGSLNRLVPVRGMRRNLRYKYAQFGELLRVLQNRLRFIEGRDPMSVQRYRDSEDERREYNELRNRVHTFLTYMDNVRDEWAQAVSSAREASGNSGESRTGNRDSNRDSNRENNHSEGRRPQREYRGGQRRDTREPRELREQRDSTQRQSQNEDGEWQQVRNYRRNTNSNYGGRRYEHREPREQRDGQYEQRYSGNRSYGNRSYGTRSYGNRQYGENTRQSGENTQQTSEGTRQYGGQRSSPQGQSSGQQYGRGYGRRSN